MSESVRVGRVKSRRALDLFVEIGYRILGTDSLWVPPPRMELRTLLDRNKHPFHEHGRVDYFLAFRGKKCVGRIAAIENFAHNLYHKEKIAHFGFLAAEPDEEVFRALLERAESWARDRGLTALRGPASFSTNEEVGLLVDGFESPPFIMMPWTPDTWPALVEACGYSKAHDLFSYWVSRYSYKYRMDRIADAVIAKMERRGIKVEVRPLIKERLNEELEYVRRIYNDAWAGNWGFVPMTESEVAFMAKELRMVLVPDLIQFVFLDGKPAAFALSLPDFNVALRHMEGKLGPKQIALFLALRKRIHQLRMLAMGVCSEFRGRGLETLLVSRVVTNGLRLGFTVAELGWILEDNVQMNRELLALGARHYKTHRIYEKSLA